MANSKSLATIGFVAFSGSEFGILLGLYLASGCGFLLGKSSVIGSETWNCLEFLS
jgi:hypothetical protein